MSRPKRARAKPAKAAQDAKVEKEEAQADKGKGKEKAKEPVGTIKKATRKVNELAHANFKRLKLRSKGGKAGPGHNSRFRRRR